MRRNKMKRSKSESLFTNTAKRPHPKNNQSNPMRGGIRL